MPGIIFLLGVTALVIFNVAARVRVDAEDKFNDLPRPNHIGS